MSRINGPILINNGEQWLAVLKNHDGRTLFFLDNVIGKELVLAEVTKSKYYSCGYAIKELWSVDLAEQNDTMKYQISYHHTNKEQFLETLRADYPSHFEWFLWNQEILNER